MRRFLLFYPDLATMLGDMRRLAVDGRLDAVQGAILAAPTGGWAFRLDAVRHLTGNATGDDAVLSGLSDDPKRREPSTLPYADYVNRLDALEAALRGNGQWAFPHPWLTTFLGDSTVQTVVAGELARLAPADPGPFGQVVLSPILNRAITSPLMRLPSDSLCYAFNLVRLPATGSPSEAARLVAANRATYERIRAAGGTLDPVSALPMSRGDWRRHLGSAFARLREAKSRFDPDRVLTPGYEIFPRRLRPRRGLSG